jgi:hypothetical protein
LESAFVHAAFSAAEFADCMLPFAGLVTKIGGVPLIRKACAAESLATID